MTIGARAAGFDVLFGVEYDPDLAVVYRANLGDHVAVADVTTLNMADLPRVDVFHASPPCTNASVANANGGESPQDLAMAQAVCRYIMAKQPDIVTLENVYQYRNFESWHEIARTLLAEGYTYNYWHVNMANYGVPQTRKRMIVVARRDNKTPQLPEQTHAENPTPGLFGTKARWVSWYEAVEDLIPTLPDSQFAPWQLERLPEKIMTSLIMSGNNNFNDAAPGKGYLSTVCPANTVMAGLSGGSPKAFVIDGKLSTCGDYRQLQTHANGEPVVSVLVGDGDNYRPIANSEMPSPTVGASNGARAFIIDGKLSKSRDARAVDSCRVVKMTPRALARFQSFPDWYELPGNSRLAVKGIGNAVPPLFSEKLYRGME